MIKYFYEKVKLSISIVFLWIIHLKHKWKIDDVKLFVAMDIFLLSMIIPLLLSAILGSYDISTFKISLLYGMAVNCTIILLYLIKENISFSRIIYEIKYSMKIIKFLLVTYSKFVNEHTKFLAKNNIARKTYEQKARSNTVLNLVFVTIFRLYFKNMDIKHKNSEPYLIDMREMSELYHSREFNEFYTKIFFKTSDKLYKPYEYILIYLLDNVLSELYQKPWFIEYYDEFVLFKFIEHLLSYWYENIITFNISPTLKENWK